MSAPCPTLGFRLAFSFAPNASAARRMDVRSAFLRTVAEIGLVSEPGGSGMFEYTITGDGTQATESDRARLVAWLEEHEEIATSRVGPLTDVTEPV